MYKMFNIHHSRFKKTVKLNNVESTARWKYIAGTVIFINVMRYFYISRESHARIKSITLTIAKTHSHAYARALLLMAWYLRRV